MTECADTYFGDIAEAFDGYVMTEKRLMRGSLVQLFINEEPCGYCLALNVARKYKKMRGLFVNIRSIFFDEYQDEDNIYLSNEVNKLLSLCTTISSGHGKQHRRVVLYMSSNTVSLLNPYYKEFGINKMLKKTQNFYEAMVGCLSELTMKMHQQHIKKVVLHELLKMLVITRMPVKINI